MRAIPFVLGQRFGRLTAVRDIGGTPRKWLMRCDCGNDKAVRVGALRSGGTQSCGCLRHEQLSALATERNTVHGCSHLPEYRCWKNLRNRCNNANYPEFDYYGGRGIKVCPEWDSFQRFYEDMGPRPSSAHSIDRIDTNGNYEPLNCRWATVPEQNRNKRSNRLVTVDGTEMCATDAAQKLQLPLNTLLARLNR